MDLFLAICTAVGLAIAAGLVVGAAVPPVMPAWGAIAGAAPLAVIGATAALAGADEPLWLALPLGLLAGGLAAALSREVVSGAARRAGGDEPTAAAPAGIVGIVIVTAALTAVASVFVEPLALVVLGGLIALAVMRRRRDQRKYEGLRVLR